MAAEFDVSFQRALTDIQTLNARLSGLGSEMDKLESKGEASAGKYRRALAKIKENADSLEEALKSVNKDGEAMGNVVAVGSKRAEKALEALAQTAVNTTLAAKGLSNRNSELYQTLRDIAIASDYARNEKKALVAEYHAAIAAQQDYANRSSNMLSIIRQMTNAEREMALTQQKVAWGYDRLTQSSAKYTAQQQMAKKAVDDANQAMIEGEKNLQKYTGSNLQSSIRSDQNKYDWDSAEKRRAETLKELRQEIEKRYKEEDKQAAAAEKAAEATRLLMVEEARLRAEQERAVAGAKAYNANLQRQESQFAKAGSLVNSYREQLSRLQNLLLKGGDTGILNAGLTNLSKSGREATSSLSALTKQEAELQVKEERLISLLERRNALTKAQAQVNNQLSASERLQAQRLDESTQRLERQARYAQMTTAQLLGLSKGHSRISHEMRASAQAAAAFRAALGGLNASIGIYTSSTILIASATYGLAAAMRDTVSSGMEFTETMSRAEAIMMSGADGLTNTVGSMAALEMQVRALGQSTVFTATEVAGGLVDLGMAGLSSSQALTALKPSLDLASIGAIDMSESADIATNVMTTFKLEASDLAEVVDVLATAVTNSNTDISKLANALSYVGPAAQAAGFSLRDTVSAIELLSNAGIKSSKAGTGLRRFMLNLQNPTAKGAKVLDKYNIALDDSYGNTRSLIDILSQFNTALHRDGIAPSERMAAIVDLVGVRAASAVSRMVSSVEELGVLRRQLDNVAGAAEEMRQKIEDNLSSDWKQVKSSFQELQLSVFEDFQWTLRTTAAEVTNFFQSLTVVDESGVSQLDEYIARLEAMGSLVWELGQLFLTYKGAQLAFSLGSGSAKALSDLSDKMKVLRARSAEAGGSMSLLNASVSSTLAPMTMAATKAQAVGQGFLFLGRAANYALRALGWVGVVWGIYEAIKVTFGDSDPYIQQHQDRISSLKDEYGLLADQIERTQREKNRQALLAQQNASGQELRDVNQQAADIRVTLNLGGLGPDAVLALEDQLHRLTARSEELEKQVQESGEALEKLGTSHESLATLTNQQNFLTSSIADSREEVARLTDELRNAGPAMQQAITQQITALNRGVSVMLGQLNMVTAQVKEAQGDTYSFIEDLNKALEEQQETLAEDRRVDQLTVTEKMLELEQQLAEKRAEVAEMDDSDDKSLSRYTSLKEEILELQEELAGARHEYQDLAKEGGETYSEFLRLQEIDNMNLEQMRDRLAEINILRMSMIAQSVVSGETIDIEQLNTLTDRYVEMMGLISRKEEEQVRTSQRASSAAQRAAEREARQWESKLDQYRKILESADEVTAATAKLKDQTLTLNSLLDAGKISQEDHAAAMGIITEKFWDNVAAGDAFLATLRSINDEWEEGGPAGEGGWLQTLNAADHLRRPQEAGESDADYRMRVGRGNLLEANTRFELEQEAESAVPGFDQDYGFEDNKFGEANRLQRDGADAREQAGLAIDQLRLEEQRAKNEERLEDAEEFARQREQIEANLQNRLRQIDEQSNRAMLLGASQSFGDLANITKAFAGEQSAIYQTMFAASKAFAIAESIISINLAIAKATASGATWQEQLAAMATITSATAGIVSSIQSVSMAASGGGESGGGDSSYAGMYDKGGQIPAGQYGIVGEYGPEIVHGPANVTSRKKTADMMGGSNLTFSPVIQVTVESSGNDSSSEVDKEDQGRKISKEVEATVMNLFQREMRPNGVLDRWKRS